MSTRRTAKPKSKSTNKPSKKQPGTPSKRPPPDALTVTVSDATRTRWRAAARLLPPEAVGISGPLSVLLGESVDVARFTARRWEPQRDEHTHAVTVPGLASAVRKDQPAAPFALTPTLHEGTAQEVLELNALTQEAQTRYLLCASAKAGASPRVEAVALRSDLRAAVESYLDDGVETDDDIRLERVRDAHAKDPDTADALAGELVDYAALAEGLLPGIGDYGDFSAAWITRAGELAATLRARPDVPVTQESKEALAALDERNRLATLLAARMRLVRAKARFVFRAHPSLLREATSAYGRRQRAAHRSKAKTPATPTPA